MEEEKERLKWYGNAGRMKEEKERLRWYGHARRMEEEKERLRCGRVKNHFRKNTLSTTDRGSSLDLTVISSLICCESRVLDHAATEVGLLKR
uniref:Uncharacterized protein n=1 Tax=Timema poppense TaxID=170557 RepID=A0A7R9H1Y1_TIMPO|nr:unnamed protein product [Timema poppensis]